MLKPIHDRVGLDLSDQQANAARAADFSRYPAEIVREVPEARWMIQGGNVYGQIGLLSKSSGLLDYFLQYQVAIWPPLGRCAIEVKLWQSANATEPDIARIGLQDILLSRFDSLISEPQPAGRAFWESQIATLADRKLVGLIEGRKVQVFNQSCPIAEWSEHWLGRKASGKRFFISNLTSIATRPEGMVEGLVAAPG